ncbi:MAG: HAMP domain-containing histidine kinase [Clostridia bacterium]|nr:HAMP domain-containing histidine kinase [Clostridia bacterium]
MKWNKMRKSIITRWLLGVFSIVVAFVIAAVILLCGLLNSYIENSIKEQLPSYVDVFEGLKNSSEADFREAAVNLTENFEFMDKVKVVVFDSQGKMIASTEGLTTQENASLNPEYKSALSSKQGMASWSGIDAHKNDIMATTVIIFNKDGNVKGSYRYIISKEPYKKTVTTYNTAIVLIGLFMILVSGISGVYFIASIVRPVRDVTSAARKIAQGELDTRLNDTGSGEIGELCDTINFMAEELGKTETLKNDFISSVSHELRTPLTAIKGWGETVNMSIGYDDATVKRGIDVMLTETDRLAKLVEELLDFSRMQTGTLRVNMTTISISNVLGEVVGMYEELAKQQGLAITYFPPKADVMIMADRDRIKQVFVNIIDNAVKYTSNGGDVIISHVTDEQNIRIIVSDTGAGIPESDIGHVKEKFYKANNSVRGSGIGLAVADEIVGHHGGSITIESKENVGTNVTVSLPIKNMESEETNEEQMR